MWYVLDEEEKEEEEEGEEEEQGDGGVESGGDCAECVSPGFSSVK